MFGALLIAFGVYLKVPAYALDGIVSALVTANGAYFLTSALRSEVDLLTHTVKTGKETPMPDDPEILEMKELGRIERGRMGSLRAPHYHPRFRRHHHRRDFILQSAKLIEEPSS